jgi:malate dehydrogenase (quinone)
LDSRVLDGQKALLFGPFAAWTTKFLHEQSSWTDLFASVKPDNFATLVKIGVHNVPLVRYLMRQGTQSMANRVALLRTFYPEARESDWKLKDAGIRVQAIKQTDGEAGIVHYGTEVITDADRSLSALLGASPGASVSVSIALDLLKQCFGHLLQTPEGRQRMLAMVPTFDQSTVAPDKAHLLLDLAAKNNAILGL